MAPTASGNNKTGRFGKDIIIEVAAGNDRLG